MTGALAAFHEDRPLPGDAIPFGSNSLQHGTAVFEGIRGYAGVDGPALFRLDDHLNRLLDSARLLGVDHDYDLAGLRAHVLSAAAGHGDVYVRPLLTTLDTALGVDLRALRFTLVTGLWPVPGRDVRPSRPARLTVSPWRRPSTASFPVRAKATGSYANSALARTAAVRAGFDDAVQLDPVSGRVAEGTVTNVFLVAGGVVRTPWLADSVLAGITRDSVLRLARDLGLTAEEGPVTEAELRDADEVFLTGTASELVRVGRVDGAEYRAGPVFDALAEAFRRATTGPDEHGWLTPVPA
ncbi:aminotransferase class IV [Actinosynnema pretiosum subsp. pretiosum]|uniref:Aminotransferase class IV n=2 Tax=Actinosynnema TaxID=40566 RepID=C6WQP5_ACTMD|nr:aminotransferase class IV [Actinosynnema mirum]ACU38735.1 aminotransferase class IV [Actinosynnema mirum DSM 43827]AXX32332.1 Branched-chain amino acid aminotransferase [Actinosynnema pretiosum subsp. pretiosum]QUF03724.1 aminotransferase class IV [Actinosynnema pretiosum subsp. pretiosum]